MTKLILDNLLPTVAGAVLGVLAIYWLSWFSVEFYAIDIHIHLQRLGEN